MKKISFGMVMLMAILAMAAGLCPAQARDWKPKAKTLAQNYAEIVDSSKKGELTILFWFPAPMFTDEPEAAAMAQNYVIIGAVHANIDPGGVLAPVHIDTLQPLDGSGKPLTLIPQDNLPPTVAGFVAAFGGVMAQSLGVIGQGMQYFVFEAGSVDACKKGGLSVPLNGETYTYDTPIPGCPVF
jgi:hypothetical protein